MERRKEIHNRARAATPGPWKSGPTPKYLMASQEQHGMGLPLTIRSPEHHSEEIATVWTYLLPTEANAEFIARSREDISWLLESLEEALDALQAYDALFRAWEGRDSLTLNEEAIRQWRSIALDTIHSIKEAGDE